MALSFHLDGKPLPSSPLKCFIHKDKDDCFYLDMDGYYFYLPHVPDYAGIVEHLIILQESFEKGFTLVYPR